jgi:hypothetical protein
VSRELTDGVGKEGFLAEKRGSGRLFWKEKKGFTQITADQGADERRFLIGARLEVPYVLIPQMNRCIWRWPVILVRGEGFYPADCYAIRFCSKDL